MLSPQPVAPERAHSRRVIRAIALVEAFKGVVVLVAASGVLALVHENLNDLAARLVAHAHLNPAAEYPHIFLDAVARVHEPRLLWLAAGAATYSLLRYIEAYGLYLERAWAEWLAALSGAFYIPLEAFELLHKPSALSVGLLLVNAAVVAVMVGALRQRRSRRGDSVAPSLERPASPRPRGFSTRR